LSLPSAFCWSKFGSEAGEPSASIRARKEIERRRNGGLFLWGIGTSIRPSLLDLLRISPTPEVYFTPMLSRPASIDANPNALALWCGAIGIGGEDYSLPPYSVVTSRRAPGQRDRKHYALVCRTCEPLDVNNVDVQIDSSQLCNLRTGSAVGSSQVTAVVRRQAASERGRLYRVAFRASLVHPFLLELAHPLAIPEELRIDRRDVSEHEEAMHKLLDLKDSYSTQTNRQLVLA
jgi:hypothetical protein